MNASFFQDLLGSIAERGRSLIERSGGRPARARRSAARPRSRACAATSSPAAARRRAWPWPARCSTSTAARRPRSGSRFFRLLARDFGPDRGPAPRRLGRLRRRRRPRPTSRRSCAPSSRRARSCSAGSTWRPAAPRRWSRMREDLLKLGGDDPELASVDDDLAHLLSSWFNRGFLVLRRIDWSTPADILERIIRYEAVHEIQGWDDLRRRVQPQRPALLRLLPPLDDRRAADLRRGGADPRDPRLDPGPARRGAGDRPGPRGDDGGVLLDQQLPARAARRLVRQLPDQAGGRGAVARAAVAHDLRHPLAGARVRRLARQARDRRPELRARLASRRCSGRACARPSCCRLAAAYFLARERLRAASRSIRSPASTSATAPGSSG